MTEKVISEETEEGIITYLESEKPSEFKSNVTSEDVVSAMVGLLITVIIMAVASSIVF